MTVCTVSTILKVVTLKKLNEPLRNQFNYRLHTNKQNKKVLIHVLVRFFHYFL